MKFLDALLGRTKLIKPKIEALFALSTAQISMDLLGFNASGTSGICFKPVESSQFAHMESDLRELLVLSASDTGTEHQFRRDEYGYTWIILSDEDFDDLVTTTHMISEIVIDHKFEERLLCSVFSFGKLYLIYNYKEGTFYPFAPTNNQKRDEKLEFRVRSAMESEIPIEKEMEKWYPLWGIPF